MNFEFENTDDQDEEIPEFYDEDTRLYCALTYILFNLDDLEIATQLDEAFEKLTKSDGEFRKEYDDVIDSILVHLRKRFDFLDVFKQKFQNDDVKSILRRFEIQYFIDQIEQNSDSPFPNYALQFLEYASKDFHEAIDKADALLMEKEDYLIAALNNLENDND
ncbi:hypothetical protein LPTSP4_35730 [Leptospira ryugenii]|uniref:Uncharacterized protein n=1 Tax=Leptospira ryugenii TaxID=1917863 RepID=A0A2P2E567_9LEPT|nr:hypothetical protein [Leptospira ryugenii]GBF52035.1 hypothetical protein LPTSP4_35730 [Leptospira ryugenii]